MKDQVQTALEALTRLCPVAGRSFARGRFHDWVSDPYTQGVYSHMQPGYALNHLRFIAGPFDRLHFAGEHTATWSGFMEDALESSERVANEIIENKPETATNNSKSESERGRKINAGGRALA